MLSTKLPLITLFGVALVVSACEQEIDMDQYALNKRHCWAAVVFMSKKIAQVRKGEVKGWEAGERHSVRVSYRMIPLDGSWEINTPQKGEMLCTYARPDRQSGEPKMAKGLEVTMNGTPLSGKQVENLNTMINLIGRGL